MMGLQRLLLASGCIGLLPTAFGAVHSLFVANRNTPANFHSLEFDDATNSLKLIKSIKSDATHIWTAFSYDKKSVYGSSLDAPRVSSYQVVNSSTLKVSGSVQTSGSCQGKRAANLVAGTSPPYFVFAGTFPGPGGCGMALTTTDDGTLNGTSSTWAYDDASGIHGVAQQSRETATLLYSADYGADTVWTHRVYDTGDIEAYNSYSAPNGTHPRHLMVHPNSTYAYVIGEANSELMVFPLSSSGGLRPYRSSTDVLIPEGSDPSLYWAADATLSTNARYLWATTRGKANATTGYLSGFLLDATGAISKRMFMLPTNVTGSTSTAVTAAPWSDEYAVLSDVPGGYVQVWKLDGKQSGPDGDVYTTAKAVARLNIAKGCCSNALWFN